MDEQLTTPKQPMSNDTDNAPTLDQVNPPTMDSPETASARQQVEGLRQSVESMSRALNSSNANLPPKEHQERQAARMTMLELKSALADAAENGTPVQQLHIPLGRLDLRTVQNPLERSIQMNVYHNADPTKSRDIVLGQLGLTPQDRQRLPEYREPMGTFDSGTPNSPNNGVPIIREYTPIPSLPGLYYAEEHLQNMRPELSPSVWITGNLPQSAFETPPPANLSAAA